MMWIVTFVNLSTNQPEAHAYATREAADSAVRTEWFKAYDCTVMRCFLAEPILA